MTPQHFRPDPNALDPFWKKSAAAIAEESVDYEAVAKMFHDQAYGFVANKGKVLFQDPFRLGFEIVHRDEKATRMFGVFAFRANGNLLYVPVFFINGEIKPVDIIYRTDIKRFTLFDEDWAKFLTKGSNTESGDMVDAGAPRQQDVKFNRLATPQRTKYASDEWGPEQAKAAWNEMFKHAASEEAPRRLLPELIANSGPEVIEKLAAWAEDEHVAVALAEGYTREELFNEEVHKSASTADLPGVSVVTDINQVKEASAKGLIADRGYLITDNRPKESLNLVVEEMPDLELLEIMGVGQYDMLMADGKQKHAIAMRRNYDWLSGCCSSEPVGFGAGIQRSRTVNRVYFPESKELLTACPPAIFGMELEDGLDGKEAIEMTSLKDAKSDTAYILYHPGTHECSEPFRVAGTRKAGDSVVINITDMWGHNRNPIICGGDDSNPGSKVFGEDMKILEIKTEKQGEGYQEAKCTQVPMDANGVEKWMRTCGDIAKSAGVRVTIDDTDRFTIEEEVGTGLWKRAHTNVTPFSTLVYLCGKHNVSADEAQSIIKSASTGVAKEVRIFETIKSGYVTRLADSPDWEEGYDSQLGVPVDFPQQRVLDTYTPERPMQRSHYGDHWARQDNRNPEEADTNLPREAVMSLPPEQLAQMAKQYGMTEIFDHGATLQLAESRHTVPDQIREYIPDMELGLDRYCRTLFLLRYRPGEVEEAYGKDALQDMERDFQDLVQSAGECLLRVILRFSEDKLTSA